MPGLNLDIFGLERAGLNRIARLLSRLFLLVGGVLLILEFDHGLVSLLGLAVLLRIQIEAGTGVLGLVVLLFAPVIDLQFLEVGGLVAGFQVDVDLAQQALAEMQPVLRLLLLRLLLARLLLTASYHQVTDGVLELGVQMLQKALDASLHSLVDDLLYLLSFEGKGVLTIGLLKNAGPGLPQAAPSPVTLSGYGSVHGVQCVSRCTASTPLGKLKSS